MLQKIKKVCFSCATFGGIGETMFGGLFATCLALPVLYFLNILGAWFDPGYWYSVALALTLFIALVIQGALGFETDKSPTAIVLDRFFGMIVALSGIQLGVKVAVAGLVLFNVLTLLRPFLLVRPPWLKLDELPGFLGIMAGDLCIGIVINIFFRFVFWVVW